jgi:hypothetical protein
MANFGMFLLGMVTPLLRRALLALGLGVVSYAGLALVGSQVKDAVTARYGQITGSVLDLLNLIGFNEAIGIILGGMLARLAFAAISKIGVMSS